MIKQESRQFDWEQIRQPYLEGESTARIASKIGCDSKTVLYHLNKLGLPLRTRSEAIKVSRAKYPYPEGKDNPNWKGGRFVGDSGYVFVYNPNHPRATTKRSHKGGRKYVLEHILVWEETHNRPLPKGYIIHHLNGIKTDNRPANLKALKGKKHANLIPTFQQKIRELEAENRQLRRALEDSQMIFAVSEN